MAKFSVHVCEDLPDDQKEAIWIDFARSMVEKKIKLSNSYYIDLLF